MLTFESIGACIAHHKARPGTIDVIGEQVLVIFEGEALLLGACPAYLYGGRYNFTHTQEQLEMFKLHLNPALYDQPVTREQFTAERKTPYLDTIAKSYRVSKARPVLSVAVFDEEDELIGFILAKSFKESGEAV